jgi:hypothetical protein
MSHVVLMYRIQYTHGARTICMYERTRDAAYAMRRSLFKDPAVTDVRIGHLIDDCIGHLIDD